MLKRVFDFVVALVLLLLTLPVWLVIAVFVTAQDGGSPFFRQPRVGKDGKPFLLWKFRSMIRDAASKGGHQTHAGDPRITNIGAFLRRTSLDELPQFLNVLAGEMSLVGPRPDTPMQERDYPPEIWQRRVSVTPGITGYAQVMQKGGFSERDRTSLDLEYIERQDFWLDLWIIAQTFLIVLRRKNR
ncbi:sugar transferase [Algicella marina]|uniref:Sugar transferase n=1 Tax=Algicella marina TaxID=2683284 RepID=A0A6P1SSP1_9RHOB|nr:sugar transferase [Algicella marina]QHQ33694.1 sugar transferase [Algicella marina]